MASGGETIELTRKRPPAGSPEYLEEAYHDLGICEWVLKGGKRVSNPAVVKFAVDAIGYPVNTMDVPWCAIYIGAKLKAAGFTPTGQATARSYLKWGQEVDHGDDSDWKVGDICIIWRGRSNDGVTGHIFFLVDWDDEYVVGLGGNQGDHVSLQKFPRSKIIGVRRPRKVYQSKTITREAGAVVAKVTEQGAQHLIPDQVAHAATNPVPPASGPMTPDQLAETVAKVKGPLDTLGDLFIHYKPVIVGLLSIVAIVLALYALWYRFGDFKSGKNA